MSDVEDLRTIYNLHDCEGYDVIDSVSDIISKEYQAEEELYLLRKGREVHRITLTRSVPATVVSAELNIPLECDIELSKFNALDHPVYTSPGSWFVRQGFIVRSRIEDGSWVQYAFKSEGPNNLVRSEVIEYLDVAGLEYDPNTVVEFGPTKVIRS